MNRNLSVTLLGHLLWLTLAAMPLRSHAIGGPETLTLDEVDDPVAGPGEVLVAVHAAGINFLDTLIVRDEYQIRPPRPFAPGAELSGVVEAVGEGVTRFRAGDRVVGLPAQYGQHRSRLYERGRRREAFGAERIHGRSDRTVGADDDRRRRQQLRLVEPT